MEITATGNGYFITLSITPIASHICSCWVSSKMRSGWSFQRSTLPVVQIYRHAIDHRLVANVRNDEKAERGYFELKTSFQCKNHFDNTNLIKFNILSSPGKMSLPNRSTKRVYVHHSELHFSAAKRGRSREGVLRRICRHWASKCSAVKVVPQLVQ